jgi:medium-chain acyl-[acyl-carrier-protein] hydrolase
LPGRGTRFSEPLFTDLAPLIEAAGTALAPELATGRSFALFGHSMGSLLAFELARWLRRHGGRAPSHVFASGHGAPQLPPEDAPIHALPHDEFIAALRDLNGTPPEVLEHAELLELLLPVLRADCGVSEKYTYTDEPPLECPVTALGGASDPDVPVDRLEAWRAQTRGAFTARVLPGDHFYLQSAQALVVETLVAALAPAAAD